PKYGKFLGGIRNTLATLDGNDAMDELEAQGAITFEIDGSEIVLTKEDLLIEMTKKEGFESLGDRGVTVVIDKNLTPELIEEGNVREIISKIQTMRKDSGFEVMDNIKVAFSGNDTVWQIAEKNAQEIMDETLATSVSLGTLQFAKEWNINGEKVTVSVEKIN
ncbi:MAG: isoleucine--tRNA ligase, partial [Clostridia bacterium]|nr:isoleucine--tRNA ligase [Clostridia bacterium]